MKVTINQIAELAQVSKGTVSKVLNGHRGISSGTRDRILKLVKQLDYHPDASARALALQKTGVLGFLIPHEAATSLTGNYWTAVLSGTSHQAAQAGYNLLVLTPPQEGDLQGALDQVLKRSTVDGLIIGSELLDRQSLADLVLRKVPFVLLGRNPDFEHYAVDIDNAQGTQLMIQHMVTQGYRKIGALLGPSHYPYTREREDAYLKALADSGLSWTASRHCDYRSQSIRSALESLLDSHPDMDGLFLASGGDFLFDTLKIFRARKITVPEFGLGTFDDYPFMELLSPPVTAIRQPLLSAGGEAVHLLLQLIQKTTPVQRLVTLPTSLVKRESCGEVTRAK
jgi:LacI family transcriptional regulator